MRAEKQSPAPLAGGNRAYARSNAQRANHTDDAGELQDTRRRPATGEGSVVVRVIQKLRAAEEALRLIREKELKPIDMVVLVYLTSNLDNTTGETVRRWQTIAEGCGVERSTVWRSLRRLKACGLVAMRERKYDRPGAAPARVANAYRLGLACAPLPLGEWQGCHGMVSRLHNHPIGQARQNGRSGGGTEPVDWNAEAKWLRDRAGDGTPLSDVHTMLDSLRAQCGDRAIFKAIGRAKSFKLYGPRLWDYLSRTYPENRRQGGAP